MKHLAILLTAVSLGSGCIVSSTCDTPGTLWVDWSFVNASGNTAYCGTGLSRPVIDVDVWIDGVRQAYQVPCTDYGVAVAGVPAGSHTVMVAGFNGTPIVARDFFSVDVCGDTSVLAYPGEGILRIKPSNCDVAGDALAFSITDVTMATPYVIWSELPGGTLNFTCGGGIEEYVPLGYYDLKGLEEWGGGTRYASLCETKRVDVTTPATITHAVTFSDITAPIAACF